MRTTRSLLSAVTISISISLISGNLFAIPVTLSPSESAAINFSFSTPPDNTVDYLKFSLGAMSFTGGSDIRSRSNIYDGSSLLGTYTGSFNAGSTVAQWTTSSSYFSPYLPAINFASIQDGSITGKIIIENTSSSGNVQFDSSNVLVEVSRAIGPFVTFTDPTRQPVISSVVEQSTPTLPTCVPPQVLQGNSCVTPPPPTCIAPQVLQGSSCVTPPPPTCVQPQVLQGNSCVAPPPTTNSLMEKIKRNSEMIASHTVPDQAHYSWAADAITSILSKVDPQYPILHQAAMTFHDGAKVAIQNAQTLAQNGDVNGATHSLNLAIDQFGKSQIATAQSILAYDGLVGPAEFVTKGIYLGSQIAWDTTCAFAGPWKLSCAVAGDALYLVLDSRIDAATLPADEVIQRAVKTLIVNAILPKILPEQFNVSGNSSLTDNISQVINSPTFRNNLHEVLTDSSIEALNSDVVSRLEEKIYNILTDWPYPIQQPSNPQIVTTNGDYYPLLQQLGIDASGSVLYNTGQIVGQGAITSNGLINIGALLLDGGSSTVSGDVSNLGLTVIAGGTANFSGNINNSGTFAAFESTVDISGTFYNIGHISGDPSKIYFNDLVIGPTGYMTGMAGDLFSVRGNFNSCSTQSLAWDTAMSTLAFTGAGSHQFDLTGQDVGANLAGYQDNFAWGLLDLSNLLGSIYLDNCNSDSNSNNALYINDLLGAQMANGIITNIYGNGENIYYLASDIDNAYLNRRQYELTGGGYLIPVGEMAIPEPQTLWLVVLGFTWIVLRRRQSQAKS